MVHMRADLMKFLDTPASRISDEGPSGGKKKSIDININKNWISFLSD